MEGSSTRAAPAAIAAWVALLVVVDLGARLAAPASLMALIRQEPRGAVASAALVAVLAAVRSLLAGRAYERVLLVLWNELVGATRAHSVADLRVRPDIHRTAALLDSVAAVAQLRANDVPRGIADVVGLVATLVAVVVILGPSFLVMGAGALALAALVLVVAQRAMKRAQQQSFARFVEAVADFEVLVDAATELRAHGREGLHAARIAEHVTAMARAQRRAVTHSVLSGLFPVGVALLAVVAPTGLGIVPWAHALDGRLLEAGVLGGAATVFGLGLARSLEGWMRSAPQRAALSSYLARAVGGHAPPAVASPTTPAATIRLDDVSMVYPGSGRATPARACFTWSPDEPGLALEGKNGSGKSTLALCLLGLLRPTSGLIRWDGADADSLDWERLRTRVVLVPQEPYVAHDRSVGWHLTYLLHQPATDADLQAALERVDVWSVLDERATRSGRRPLDTPASQLSGGERKRMHLARALLGAPELVVLDEPEAGLDANGRRWLRTFLEDLSHRCRVLVIAHDPSVLPTSFPVCECVAASQAEAES